MGQERQGKVLYFLYFPRMKYIQVKYGWPNRTILPQIKIIRDVNGPRFCKIRTRLKMFCRLFDGSLIPHNPLYITTFKKYTNPYQKER